MKSPVDPQTDPAVQSDPEELSTVERVRWLDTLSIDDIGIVGGKNASLGEMIRNLKGQEIKVPDGFAITGDAYWEFIAFNQLESLIRSELERQKKGEAMIGDTERRIGSAIVDGKFPPALEAEIASAYAELCRRSDVAEADVAVRSSATAEDLPGAVLPVNMNRFLL